MEFDLATLATIERYLVVSEYVRASIAEQRLPVDSIEYLKQQGLTFSEITANVIPQRTLKHRTSRGELLSREETDRVLRVARILSLATQIFKNKDKALAWLRHYDDRLMRQPVDVEQILSQQERLMLYRTPLAMLATESGGRLIEQMLWQIDEGVFS